MYMYMGSQSLENELPWVGLKWDSNPRHMYMQENVWEVIFFTHLKVKVIFSLEALLVLGPSTVDERAVCV